MRDFLLKYEKHFFFFFILIHLVPLLAVTWFVTLDGPAHLYNANLIRNSITGSGDFISGWFDFNPDPEPNWTGHFMQGVFLSFLPAWLAEKLLMVIYVISLPLSFRLLVNKLNSAGSYSSWLIFPFIYTMPFCFGFFNFSIGLPLIFTGIWYWLSRESFLWKQGLIFFLIMVLAYFSHLFVCVVLFSVITLLFLRDVLFREKYSERDSPRIRQQTIVWFSVAIPLSAMVIYFISSKGMEGFHGNFTRIPFQDLADGIRESRTLICWDYNKEKTIARFMAPLLIFNAAFILITRIKFFRKVKPVSQDIFLLVFLGLVALFFVIPDNMFSGGFISFRILLFAQLFLILWMAACHSDGFIPGVVIAGMTAISISLMVSRSGISASLDSDAKEMIEATMQMEEKKSMLPLNYSSNWLHTNLSNYAGAERNIIVLDNYEAAYPQFPLKWKTETYPYRLLGTFASSNKPCVSLDGYETVSGQTIDYILMWEHQPSYDDSCTTAVNALLGDQFRQIFISAGKKAVLYKRK